MYLPEIGRLVHWLLTHVVQEVQSREQPRPHAHFPLPLSLFLPPNSIKRSVFLLFLLTFNLCKYPLESHI